MEFVLEKIFNHGRVKLTVVPRLNTGALVKFTMKNSNRFLETPFSPPQVVSVSLTSVPYDDDDELQQDWYSRV